METMNPRSADPDAKVACRTCNWEGKVRDCICEPESLVRCPECGQPVERIEN